MRIYSQAINGKTREIFQIPVFDKFIVYAPFKKIAFLANQAFINLLVRLVKGKRLSRVSVRSAAAVRFINEIKILEPDPEFLPETPVRYQPINAVLFLINRCNLKCLYCYAKSNEWPLAKMPLKLAYQAIDLVCKNALERNLDHFELGFHGGGEPTLNWETLTKAVQHARRQAIKAIISASSNGYLNQKQRDFILDYFDGLSLSFDGLPDIQNRQRPTVNDGNSFLEVMKTIRAFDQKSFPYGIRMTVTKDSAKNLARMVSFVCEETGAKIIQVEPVFPRGRGKTMSCLARRPQFLSNNLLKDARLQLLIREFFSIAGLAWKDQLIIFARRPKKPW